MAAIADGYDGRWPVHDVWAWVRDRPTPVGCNFIPSTAINQIEMWSAGTYDRETIDRELGWAATLGFNSLRVYLHDVVWRTDPTGFLERVDDFLERCSSRGITPLLVVFDDCWHEPVPGRQPSPRQGVHNSGWARSPGRARLADRSTWRELEAYVRDVYDQQSLELLDLTVAWVRSARPSQPVTVGEFTPMPRELRLHLAELSDIVSFHSYREVESLHRQIERLRVHERPLWCTEYLNRREGCTFEGHLDTLLTEGVGAWNWGLVDGRTQTKWAWTDPVGGPVPEVWFHDILHPDGTPYDPVETAWITDRISRDRA